MTVGGPWDPCFRRILRNRGESVIPNYMYGQIKIIFKDHGDLRQVIWYEPSPLLLWQESAIVVLVGAMDAMDSGTLPPSHDLTLEMMGNCYTSGDCAVTTIMCALSHLRRILL